MFIPIPFKLLYFLILWLITEQTWDQTHLYSFQLFLSLSTFHRKHTLSTIDNILLLSMLSTDVWKHFVLIIIYISCDVSYTVTVDNILFFIYEHNNTKFQFVLSLLNALLNIKLYVIVFFVLTLLLVWHLILVLQYFSWFVALKKKLLIEPSDRCVSISFAWKLKTCGTYRSRILLSGDGMKMYYILLSSFELYSRWFYNLPSVAVQINIFQFIEIVNVAVKLQILHMKYLCSYYYFCFCSFFFKRIIVQKMHYWGSLVTHIIQIVLVLKY